MEAECQRPEYHNDEFFIAHGPQLTTRTVPFSPVRFDGVPDILSRLVMLDNWITQCTYRRLLKYYSSGEIDPPVLLVAGYAVRSGDRFGALLSPFYQFDSYTDLNADTRGTWAIVLRDSSGAAVARYAFEPAWTLEHIQLERPLLAFAYRVETTPAVRQVDIEGPTGTLASRRFSAHPPRVEISSPDRDGALVTPSDSAIAVRWTASDPDGDSLVATVLYSDDGGTSWTDLALDLETSELQVKVDPAESRELRVLVRVSDGARSTDAIRIFRINP